MRSTQSNRFVRRSSARGAQSKLWGLKFNFTSATCTYCTATTTASAAISHTEPTFLDLPSAPLDAADVVLLPLPFEGTVSYGGGTAGGPAAIWRASAEVELWDEELSFDLGRLRIYSAEPIAPLAGEDTDTYLARVADKAAAIHNQKSGHALVVGVGGEHSLTPPLATAACGGDLSRITVVQFDAHADLRDTYEDTPHSHACAMRRVVDAGARVIAVGLRSLAEEEAELVCQVGRDSPSPILSRGERELVEGYFAQDLASGQEVENQLISRLGKLSGSVYLTFDIDALEVHLCPGTGTPQPGGLGWWQALRYLRELLLYNTTAQVIGIDLVETAPMPGSQVNEFVAARLLAKMLAYHCQ